jgi:hypothetical protein
MNLTNEDYKQISIALLFAYTGAQDKYRSWKEANPKLHDYLLKSGLIAEIAWKEYVRPGEFRIDYSYESTPKGDDYGVELSEKGVGV